MVMSSLQPSDLGEDLSGISPLWVQLSNGWLTEKDLSIVLDSVVRESTWLKKLFSKNPKSRAFALYLLSSVGSNWRARVLVAELIKAAPENQLHQVNNVLQSTRGVLRAVKEISSSFPNAKDCNLAVHKLLIKVVLKNKIHLNDDTNKVGGKSPQHWLLNAVLSNALPKPDGTGFSEVFEVPQFAMVIIHNWLIYNMKKNSLTVRYLDIDPPTP